MITSVQASGFQTTVRLRLDVAPGLTDDDTILVEPSALLVAGLDAARVAKVTREGQAAFEIVLKGAPLSPTSALIAIGITSYAVVPAGDETLRLVPGPWFAVGTVDTGAVPEAATSPNRDSKVDTGADLVFVLDEVSFDGMATSVTYHLEGNLEGVSFLPGVPGDLSEIPGLDVANGETAGTVVILGRPPGNSLRFPSAIRKQPGQLQAILQVGTDEPTDVTTGTGSFTVGWFEPQGSQFIVELVGDGALATLSPGTSSGVWIEDDVGNRYDLAHGRGMTPARWNDPRPPRVLLLFTGSLPPPATSVTIHFATYDVLIVGNWEVPVTIP
ncbi:MAG: hypothetical protein IT302_08660 [Dehalococcoidia bacterium]|nr:hypothetical protein [Dehalococcoidia bacterium]